MGKAFAFLLLLSLLYALIQATLITYKLPSILSEVKEQVVTNFPDIHAVVANGELSVFGIDQPYSYEFVLDNEEGIVIVDTFVSSSAYNAATFAEGYDFGILVTRDLIIVDEPNGRGELFHVSDVDGLDVTKQDIVAFIEKIPAFLPTAAVFIIVVIALFIGITIRMIFFTILASLFVLLWARITKKVLKFEHIFTIGLFANTLPLLIEQLYRSFTPSLPGVYSLLWALLVAATIWGSKESTEEAAIPPAPQA